MRCRSVTKVSQRRQRAFTLVEAMVVSATLVIVIGSVILCNLFGLSMAVRQQIWMGASDDACKTVSTLMQDIRGATSLEVGNYAGGVFTQTASNTNQTGSALMLFPTSSNTVPFTLYYYDSVSNTLVRSNFISTGSPADVRLVTANHIVNDNPIFTEVSNTNTILTTSTPTATVSVYLSFSKLQNPQVVIASGSLVDFYQIVLCVSPRTSL